MIDRSLVAIVDIESFTKRNASNQARLVRGFVDDLNERLRKLAALKPDAWSTGDGAIISVGRSCTIDEETTTTFVNFLIDFVEALLRSGVVVRAAMNYAEHDRIVPIADGLPLKGQFVQVGNTINDAARILTFCEPREILVDQKVIGLLRDLDLEYLHEFVPNDPFRTKHEQVIFTHSYRPRPEHRGLFYDPSTPLHRYKRFSNFPPIKSDTLEYFIETGLEFEIRRVVTQAYEALESINETKTFLSWSAVLKVLVQLAYDPTDDVIIVSRNDQPGFWTQARRVEYLSYLDRNRGKGYINQTRIMVYNDLPAGHVPMASDLMPTSDEDLHTSLMKLHKTNSYYSYPSSQLFTYERINQLRFGFTLSRKHRLAIIPVPAPDDVELGRLSAERIGELLSRYPNYDPVDGPMKAVITADSKFITDLDREFREIVDSPYITLLK